MRTESEVESRLRALLVQEVDRRVEEASKRRPHLCVHNYRHSLDDRKMVEGEFNESYNRITSAPYEPVGRTIGLCLYGQEDPQNWKGDICEDAIDAQRCPVFKPIKTKDTILSELGQQLVEPGWVEGNLPGVAELLWVLERTEASPIPWWKRLWYRWVLRIRVEPCLRAAHTPNLLPAPGDSDNEGVGT